MNAESTGKTYYSEARSTFAELEAKYTELRDRLFWHAKKFFPEDQDAQDMVSITMMKAIQFQNRFDGKNLTSWLYKICTRTCLDDLRQKKRHPTQTIAHPNDEDQQNYLDLQIENPAYEPENLVIAQEDREEILNRLPIKSRNVILEVEAGHTLQEIANELNVHKTTVSLHKRAAREALKDKV